MTEKVITVAITGASGTPYAMQLLRSLFEKQINVYLLISSAAKIVIKTELGLELPVNDALLKAYFCDYFSVKDELLQVFGKDDWMASVASGSNPADHMVICPCSMGSLSAIAHGSSNNLIERAADVMLKEKRALILVTREMPLSSIHLENMLKLSRMGVTIMPASPGFYHHPQDVNALVDFVVARILDHLRVPHSLSSRWGRPAN
jgi:4-hydroxy-3-polyprenylbenzoate decarboxylase